MGCHLLYLLTQTSLFELSQPLPPHTDFSLWAVTASTSSYRLPSLSCHFLSLSSHLLYLLTQTSLFELSPTLPPHIDFSIRSVEEGLAQNLFLHPRPSSRPKRTEHFLRSLLIYSLYLKSYSDEVAASKLNPWDSLNCNIHRMCLWWQISLVQVDLLQRYLIPDN